MEPSLGSPAQHFDGPSECCGMLTACSVEAVPASAHRAAVETHALDDDGAIIGGIRLLDARAFVSAGGDLIAGADAVTVGIALRFHAERHGSRKRERSDDRRS